MSSRLGKKRIQFCFHCNSVKRIRLQQRIKFSTLFFLHLNGCISNSARIIVLLYTLRIVRSFNNFYCNELSSSRKQGSLFCSFEIPLNNMDLIFKFPLQIHKYTGLPSNKKHGELIISVSLGHSIHIISPLSVQAIFHQLMINDGAFIHCVGYSNQFV